MVLIKFINCSMLITFFTDLHSNMVLIKYILNKSIIINSSNLHSNMVLIKLLSLYISKALSLLFTFQYGSNQITNVSSERVNVILFTFQYGSNQIEYPLFLYYLYQNLHSNMVLIKYVIY